MEKGWLARDETKKAKSAYLIILDTISPILNSMLPCIIRSSFSSHGLMGAHNGGGPQTGPHTDRKL